MALSIPEGFQLSDEVHRALLAGRPIVALESTVLTHGLPFPDNLELASQMETEICNAGAVPATIAVLDGRVWIGASPEQLRDLIHRTNLHKISSRDLGPAMIFGWSGGTTVAGTLVAARLADIHVFATGGIGGVHREPANDISADLPELARSPLVVVCAGAKAILDLPATVEYLETVGVPVVGYQTDVFPAFYSRESGLRVSVRADSARQIADLAGAHWQLGLSSAILVANPPPMESALPAAYVETAIQQALAEARFAHISGQAVSPFLLERVSALTGGDSRKANLAFLLNNARLGAEIAIALGSARE